VAVVVVVVFATALAFLPAIFSLLPLPLEEEEDDDDDDNDDDFVVDFVDDVVEIA
jgi:hypothetical protein